MQRLIEVDWNDEDRSWTVYSRVDRSESWLTHHGAEDELANLLAIAHDNATGG
jgi:hypothetical protein